MNLLVGEHALAEHCEQSSIQVFEMLIISKPEQFGNQLLLQDKHTLHVLLLMIDEPMIILLQKKCPCIWRPFDEGVHVNHQFLAPILQILLFEIFALHLTVMIYQ